MQKVECSVHRKPRTEYDEPPLHCWQANTGRPLAFETRVPAASLVTHGTTSETVEPDSIARET
jgi:hypothetical protein